MDVLFDLYMITTMPAFATGLTNDGISRSPTLSYTQRLEQRVADLEARLSGTDSVVGDVPTGLRSDIQSSQASMFSLTHDPSSIVEPSVVSRNERVSFPESTSLFQLPGSLQTFVHERKQTEQEVDARKERLVNSAWRERAFEKLADTPV